MADATPSPPPVVDRTSPPRGVLPKHAQMWLMVGLSVGLLLIILITGKPEPSQRPATATQPVSSVPSTDRVRDYQDRLRLLDERSRQQALSEPPVPAADPFADPGNYDVAEPQDPIETEKKRREYESLFASNIAVTRRTAGQTPAESRSRSTALSAAAGTPAARPEPSLDEITESIVRAGGRFGSGSAPAPTAPGQPVQPAAESSQAASRPVSTPPIESTGPLHRVLEGTVIDAVLTNRLDGNAASPVNCMVTNAVYSHNGQYVLVPAGARVLGETKPVQALGESRLAVAFHRLVLPDGSTRSLDQFAGLNQRGDSGLRDQVNQHYLSTFGAAGAVGLIGGLSQFLSTVGLGGGGGSGNRTVVIAGGIGDAGAQATAQVMNRFLNRLPTITIREGHRVKVYVTSDLDLPAFDSSRTALPVRQP